MSPASAGGFLTTEPPGKPCFDFLFNVKIIYTSILNFLVEKWILAEPLFSNSLKERPEIMAYVSCFLEGLKKNYLSLPSDLTAPHFYSTGVLYIMNPLMGERATYEKLQF